MEKKRFTIKKYLIFLVIIVVLSGFHAFGEEWTAEQKEVWASVEGFWDSIKRGDVESALSRHHDKMIVWLSENPDPSKKNQTREEYYTLVNRSVPTFIKLKPLNITIIEHVANVFYLIKWESLNKEISSSDRELITMKKKNNKWVWIGHMGSSCKRPPPCPYGW